MLLRTVAAHGDARQVKWEMGCEGRVYRSTKKNIHILNSVGSTTHGRAARRCLLRLLLIVRKTHVGGLGEEHSHSPAITHVHQIRGDDGLRGESRSSAVVDRPGGSQNRRALGVPRQTRQGVLREQERSGQGLGRARCPVLEEPWATPRVRCGVLETL
jgi:hypothetical protein